MPDTILSNLPVISSTSLKDLNAYVSTGTQSGIYRKDISPNFSSFPPVRYESNNVINPGEIGFFVVYEDVSYLLPINPGEISINIPGRNETREIISLGEINRLKTPGLMTVTLDSFFPRNRNTVSQINTEGRFMASYEYQHLFEFLFSTKNYFRFIVTGYEISFLATIENIQWDYEFGDYENLYYRLELKEYVPYGIRLIEQTDGINTGNTTESSTPSNETNPTDTTNAQIVVGSKVVCNGRLHYDSYGSKPGITVANKNGTITYLNKGAPYPYHFDPGDATGTGWVIESAVKLL